MGSRGRRAFGSVRKLPSGRYQARYRDTDGRTHTAPQTFATVRDADRYLSLVRADLERGTWRDPRLGRITVGEWAERFLKTKSELTPKTRASYESLLRSRILPTFGARRIDQVRGIDVREWLATMAADGLSASRRRQALTLLGQLFAAATADGLIPSSPCIGIDGPRLPPPKQEYLTLEELERLADGLPARYRLIAYVLGYGGLRWGECAGLRRKSCDLLHSRLIVSEALSEVNGQLVWGETKTHQQRTVVVPAFVRDALEDHLEHFVDASVESLVFTTEHGTPLRYSNFVPRVWRPALRTAGLAATGTHIGRHTAATLLLSAGADVKDIQAQLGHRDASMTLNVYCAPVAGKLDSLAQRLDHVWRKELNRG